MLGSSLIKYREKNKLSIDDLASKLNIIPEEILMWENDESSPTVEQLIALANIYGVSLDEIVGRKKANKKEGYEARAYIKYDDNIYYRATNILFSKTMKGYLIVGIASIVLAFISLISDWDNVFPLAVFVATFTLLLRRNVKKNKNLFTINSKKNSPQLESYFWFYNDKIEVLSNSLSGKVTHTIAKNEISLVRYDERYIYFAARGLLFIVDKKMVDGNIDKIYQFFNKKIDNKNNGPKEKTKKTLLITFLILPIISLFAAIITVFALKETTAIPEFNEIICEFAWVFFVFLPIPIASIVLGRVLHAKSFNGNNTFIVGIVMSVILIFCGFILSLNEDNISHDTNFIKEVQGDVHMQLPSSGDVSVLYNYDGTVDYALIRFTSNDLYPFESNLKKDSRWETEIFNLNRVDLYSHSNLFLECEYFSVYDVDCGHYNGNIAGVHLKHQRIYLAYDVDTSLLIVVYEYNNSGVKI